MDKKFSLFGNEPNERAMSRLIHDTNSALGSLINHIRKMEGWVKKNADVLKKQGIDISSEPYIEIEYLKSAKMDIQNAIDDYYKKVENDFNTPPHNN